MILVFNYNRPASPRDVIRRGIPHNKIFDFLRIETSKSDKIVCTVDKIIRLISSIGFYFTLNNKTYLSMKSDNTWDELIYQESVKLKKSESKLLVRIFGKFHTLIPIK